MAEQLDMPSDGINPHNDSLLFEYPPSPEITPAGLKAVKGFTEFLTDNIPADLAEYEVWKQRPELARAYVRNVVIRNNPGIEEAVAGQPRLFDEQSIKQHIQRFQTEYGPQPQEDRHRFERRFNAQNRYISLANIWGRNRHEWVVANFLSQQFHILNDVPNADAFATLITAQGMALEKLLRTLPIIPEPAEPAD